MNKNRITIISPTDKRRKARYNGIMFLLLAVIIILSCIMGYNYFQSKNNKVSSETPTTTTSTTTTTTTTTEVVTTTAQVNKPTQVIKNNYIYSFSLVDGNYKLAVCNSSNNSKIAYYKLYNKETFLGESNNLSGLLIDKDKVNLTNKPVLYIEIDSKTYEIKYNSSC